MLTMKNTTFFFTALLLALAGTVFGQVREVSGTVADPDGEGYPGALVQLKLSSISTFSGMDGNYSIEIPDSIANPVLVFSTIGFETQEVPVDGKSVIDVQMEEATEELGEVVITAFGVSKEKRTLGYSTQSVDGSDLVKARASNPINGLTGKVAGLNVGPSTEMLGAPNVLLRGKRNLLYVVDGVPINTDTWNINPDDIESYTVLKGPNAAALYGFRAQNGAIMITTKRGSSKKKGLSVDYNTSTMFMNGYLARPRTQSEYGVGRNYRYAYGNDPFDMDGEFRRAPIWGPRLEGQLVPQYDSPIDPETGERTGTPFVTRNEDNLGTFTQTGVLSTHNLAVGVSNDLTDLRVSLSNSNQRGIYPNTKLNITNFNMSAQHKITDRLTLDAMFNFSHQNSPNRPQAEYGPHSYAYVFGVYGGPDYDVNDLKDYWRSPGIEGVQQFNREYGRTNNPWFMANEWMRTHEKNDLFGYVRLGYDFDEHTKLQVRGNTTMWDALRTEEFPYSAETYGQPDRAGDYVEDSRALTDSKIDLLLTYDNDELFDDWQIHALGGVNARHFGYNSSYVRTTNLVIPGVYSFTNSENPVRSYSFESNMMVLSGYASLDVGYKGYFTLSGTGHWDKLSTLPVGDQNYFYPSMSLSSVVSHYLDLPDVISFLKVRGSYASVQGGLIAQRIGPSFAALGMPRPMSYGMDWYTRYDGPSYQNQNTYNVGLLYNSQPSANFNNVLANDELRPFNVDAYETGVDMMFLDNRLGLDFTYFQTLNGPQIFRRDVAPSTGYDQRNVNDVITRMQGYEIAIKGTPILKKDFRWDVLANYSTYVERYHEINDPSGTIVRNGHAYSEGERVDAAYGRSYVRDQQGNIIHDANGYPIIPPEGPETNSLLGYGNSDFAWGLHNNFRYKNWSLGIQFDGRVGGKVYNDIMRAQYRGGTSQDLVEGAYGEARRAEWESLKETGSVEPSYVGDGVQLVGGSIEYDQNGNVANYDELEFEENTTPAEFQEYIIGTSSLDEPWVHSKTFMKLREVVISYNLPGKWLKNTFVDNASVSLVGRNLLYFAERKDIDVDMYPGSALQPSSSENTTNARLQSPSVRRYGFNINVSF